MKKNLRIFFATLAMTACGMANAQQLPNGTFDATWVTCKPWLNNSTPTTQGTQPEGWCISNVAGMQVVVWLGGTTVGFEGVGRNGTGKSVIIRNTPNPLSDNQIVPGYITLGTTWATAIATMKGEVTEGTADGGVFGGLAFSKRPDALRFYYKRLYYDKPADAKKDNPNTNPNEKAYVTAYSWKGTWTQANVPSNTALNASSIINVTMTDRCNNVLGINYILGGAVSKTTDAELISVLGATIEGEQKEWKELTLEFNYKNKNAIPDKFNIIISANEIFGGREAVGAYNSLTIDDIELIYYHSLTSLSYGGKAVAGFNENTLNYDLSDKKYEASKVSYTVKGVAATVAESYNEMTDVLTINVTGDDGAVTTYNVQFMKKTSANFAVTDAKYGTFAAPFEVTIPADAQAYVCDGTTASGNALVLTEITGSIPANTPVVVYSEKPLSNSVAGYNEDNATGASSGLLVGVYADTTVPVGAYVLQKQGDKAVGFYKVSTANTINIKANHAYLSSTLSKAPAIFFTEDEEATAVTSLNALLSGEVESVNNASGVRQSGIQKGLNIVKTTDGSVHKILVK